MVIRNGLLASALLALALPACAAENSWSDDPWADAPASRWHGFVEGAVGGRIADDAALSDDNTLSDLRLRLETSGYQQDNRYVLKADLYADGVEGGGRADLREASYSFRAGETLDVKIGQQVLTWGTGDLLFLNDLFPKDWVAYFAGRDTEYLKAPVAALKTSYYGDQASLDLVWMPDFTADRFIDGERFSYFSPQAGRNVAAPAAKLSPAEPANRLENSEWAVRLYGSLASTEWALYGYRGFQKQPNAITAQGQPAFSRLDVLGASIRGNLGSGIANGEIAWHLGADSSGADQRLPNDQLRVLLGYEQELRPRLTLGLQYYLEQTLDYAALQSSSSSAFNPDEYRQLYTARLSYRLWRDNLQLSLFSYYSPSDQDYYIRPLLNYRFDDRLSLALGANLFGGEQAHTFFGQFADSSNLYARLRYAF